jgi:thiosulfate/3-mercaptopyruvate sulfurtransferase
MDSLVSTEWLATELGAPDLRIVDASYFLPEHGRDASGEFAAAHIPGAVFLDLKTIADTTSPCPTMLPTADAFAGAVRALGIGGGARVVIYDASPIHTSARAWWMLRHFGLNDVAVLDGGLGMWLAEGRAIEGGVATSAPGKPANLSVRDDVRTLAEMRGNLASAAEQVLDARSAARFTGEEPETRPGVAAGHIPGAKHLHYAKLFNADGTWKTAAGLRAAFDDAGVDLSRPIVTTCGSGITAAVLVFGAHLLGVETALYDGSWSEWGADPTTLKATRAAR